MAKQTLIERLQRGPTEWNRWRSCNHFVAVSLSGAELAGANLSLADLSNVNLSEANLSRAELSGANLNGANLSKAYLSYANLIDVDLIDADLNEAELNGANLIEANLTKADLSYANLSEAELIGANLSEANLTRANLGIANLSGSNLTYANLSGANLTGANLNYANLSGSNFSGANLSGAYFTGVILSETVFGDSNLTNTEGLDTCHHRGPSILDHRTLAKCGQLPPGFLRGCGLPDTLIAYLPSILTQAIQFYSCFISYSHEDKAFARRLHDGLQGRGIRCWLDEKQLLPGDDIFEAVDQGIRLWDKVLLCCSEHSLTSWWVDSEIDRAFQKEQAIMKERKTKALALIPLNLDGYLFDGWVNGKASPVRSRLAADFRGWQESHSRCEEQIEQVVRALRADEHAREKPPMSLL